MLILKGRAGKLHTAMLSKSPHSGKFLHHLTQIPPGGIIWPMKQQIKKRVTHRLKIIEGQLRGLQRMVEEEKYCINIIYQAQAIKEALSSVENFMLENHLKTHIIEQMKNGKEAKTVKEILSIYSLAKKQQYF